MNTSSSPVSKSSQASKTIALWLTAGAIAWINHQQQNQVIPYASLHVARSKAEAEDSAHRDLQHRSHIPSHAARRIQARPVDDQFVIDYLTHKGYTVIRPNLNR